MIHIMYVGLNLIAIKCWQVKEENELAVGCGFYLAHRDREPVVRHLGLQLLEHAIKYKWNDLSVQQKVYIKVSVFQFSPSAETTLLDV